MVEYFEPRRGRRDAALAAGFLLLALFLFFLPAAFEAPVRRAVRTTALRPFLSIQASIAEQRSRGVDIAELRAQRDSLAAVVAAQAALSEENRRLRALLGLRSRAEPDFVPAEVLRPGLPGAESTFLIDKGRVAGVTAGSPILAPGGLLGVIWEVDERSGQAIDWTHPDFRASAMTADGEVYGIVEPRRGRFREEDLLALTGAPFHSDIKPGTRVVSSGRGGIYPRGIPIGTVLGLEESEAGWRKTYLLQPAVRPEAAAHVLVGVQREGGDLSQIWHVGAPPDTAVGPEAAPAAAPSRPARPAAETTPPAQRP